MCVNLGTLEHRKHVEQRLKCVGKVRERLKDQRHYIYIGVFETKNIVQRKQWLHSSGDLQLLDFVR
jgi:hypothetical protein